MIIEQQLAIYRRERKRWLRQEHQRSLALLGGEAQAFMEGVWDSQLNARAAECMLEILRMLQAECPELHDRIERRLQDLGIPDLTTQPSGEIG